MKKWNHKLLHFLLIAFIGFNHNASAVEPVEEDIRWYQVEIILFTQNDEASLEEEEWNHENFVEFPKQPQELYRGETSLNELPTEPVPFTTVLESETSLNGIFKKLSRSTLTQPALHLAWIQPTKKNSPLDKVHIYPGAGAIAYPVGPADIAYEPGLGFDGLISLKRGHYLHLNIDMGFQERSLNNPSEALSYPQVEDNAFPLNSALHPQGISFVEAEDKGLPLNSALHEDAFYSETAEIPNYSSYRMKQKRRIRSGEIHYFDHPRFGIIAQVTPIELPEPEVVIEEPAQPLELPIPVDNKSRQTATSLEPAQKN